MVYIPDNACTLVRPTGEVDPNEQVEVEVVTTVANDDSLDPFEATVEATFGGETIGTERVQLDAGEIDDGVRFRNTVTVPDTPGEVVDVTVQITESNLIDTGGESGSFSDLRLLSMDASPNIASPTGSVSVDARIENTGDQPVNGGVYITVDGRRSGESIREIPANSTFTINVSAGQLDVGQRTITATLTDGSNTGASLSETIEVRTITEPDPEPEPEPPEDDVDDGGGGGGTTDPEPTCGPNERYSESIGECIPDCPQGQSFFPGLGCLDVTSEGYSPQAGRVSPELAGMDEDERLFRIMSGPEPESDSGGVRRRSGR